MSCPHAPPSASTIGVGVDTRGDAVVEDFARFTATYLPAFYATALFDQVALPSVAAGVDWTGRIRDLPFDRALRSAAADQLVFLGAEADARRESERIVRLHRDVRGTAPDGTHFAALHPESWNWILMSTFRMYRGAYEHVIGRSLEDAENQAVWDYVRAKGAGIEHPDERFRLPASHDEMAAYYDRIAADSCRANDALSRVVEFARRPAPPPGLPLALRPLWHLIGPVAGRVLSELGFSLLHPDIRHAAGLRSTLLDRQVVNVTGLVLRGAYRWLPDRVVLTPLAYHRSRYERLARRYHDIALTDFRPDPRAAREPGATLQPVTSAGV